MSQDFSCLTKIKNARRQRKCYWCGIKTEHKVYRHVGVFQGDFGTSYWHPECYAAMNKCEYSFYDEGWPEGEHSRGRRDDENLPPEFDQDGKNFRY